MDVAVDPTSVGVKQRETQRRICLKDHEPRWLTNGLRGGTPHRNTETDNPGQRLLALLCRVIKALLVHILEASLCCAQ